MGCKMVFTCASLFLTIAAAGEVMAGKDSVGKTNYECEIDIKDSYLRVTTDEEIRKNERKIREANDEIEHAAQVGNTLQIQTAIDKGADVNGGALLDAARCGHEGAVTFLLSKGADINKRFILNLNHTALNQAMKRGHLHIVKMLIENGAKINFIDDYGRTILHSAALGSATFIKGNHLAIIELFLTECNDKQKMDLFVKDAHGDNPLELAEGQLRGLRTAVSELRGDPRSGFRTDCIHKIKYLDKVVVSLRNFMRSTMSDK